jgi:hypothetical protein
MTLDSELERLGEQMAGRRTSGAQVTPTPAVSQPTGLTKDLHGHQGTCAEIQGRYP